MDTVAGQTSGKAAPRATEYDVVVVGGGHNALVAAAYLGRAGLRVVVLERLPRLGGAAVSDSVFSGHPARLSKYSYLVSLLPTRVVRELGLRVELRSRAVASFTPVLRDGRHGGLLVEREPGAATAASFRALTGDDTEYAAWREFYGRLGRLAMVLAPTLLEPLRAADEVAALVRAEVDAEIWAEVFERPLGELVERAFRDDTVRGVVVTDALIGTHADAHDASLAQNRCFLYHVIGDGTGEWKVPVGGMGAVTGELERVAREAGATLRTSAEVTSVAADGRTAQVSYLDADGGTHTLDCRFVLAGCAPRELDRLRGRAGAGAGAGSMPGCQLKVNLLLERLPRLRSGTDPRQAFAGTFHIDEDYATLAAAYQQSRSGQLPDPLPAEVYCHTLTDRSILGRADAARHTLTLFGLHTPADLFVADPDGARAAATRLALAGINRYLAEPIEDCLARDAEGRPCVDTHTPLDLDAELRLPAGNIFHNELSWPYAADPDEVGGWGVATDVPNLLMCGSGARRGGAVSGIPGHNAARAVLDATARRAR